MMNLMMRLWKDEEGQGMVEYGLIIALIAIVVMVTLSPLGTRIAQVFTDIVTDLNAGG